MITQMAKVYKQTTDADADMQTVVEHTADKRMMVKSGLGSIKATVHIGRFIRYSTTNSSYL